MSRRWITVCFALAAAAAGPALADIFTWVDKDGITHVSNLPPPEDVRVTKVARAAPQGPRPRAAAREAARPAEMRALRERVDELSKEVEQLARCHAAAVRGRTGDGIRAAGARRRQPWSSRSSINPRRARGRAPRSAITPSAVAESASSRLHVLRTAIPARIPQAASQVGHADAPKLRQPAAAHSLSRDDALIGWAPVG